MLLAGCAGPPVEQLPTTPIRYGPDRCLSIAVYAYREGSGRWPLSAEALGKFASSELELDRYENLRFEPLPDGRLAVSFDSYVSRDGRIKWSEYRIELGEETATNPPLERTGG